MAFGLFSWNVWNLGPTCQFYVLKSPSHLYTLFDHDLKEKKINLPKSIFLQNFISEKYAPCRFFWRHCGGKLGLKLFWTIFFDEENTLESNTFSPLLDGIFHQRFSTDWKILVSEHTLFSSTKTMSVVPHIPRILYLFLECYKELYTPLSLHPLGHPIFVGVSFVNDSSWAPIWAQNVPKSSKWSISIV